MYGKHRPEDFLRFADDNEESGGGDDAPVGGGKEEKSDVDKLRSEYDAKVSALEKQLKELATKSNSDSVETEAEMEKNRAVNEVRTMLNKLSGAKDAAAGLEIARGIIADIGTLYATSKAEAYRQSAGSKEARADALAAEIQFDAGGDVATYKAQLMKAKSQDEMRLIATNLRLELGGKKRQTTQTQPKPDQGRGSSTRTNVLKAMEDIDLSTPEGRKQWEEKRAGFRKAIATS